jgi:signal peptidase I
MFRSRRSIPDYEFADADAAQPTLPQRFSRAVRDLFVTIVQAAILAFFVIVFVAQATVVYGHSMEPNLHTDQRLIIDKFSYRLKPPERGHVVVVAVDGAAHPLIKRVIALPGETVAVGNGRVYINGALLDEPYLPALRQPTYGPQQVPPGHVFVMGDNRLDSRDSRAFGPVPVGEIIGRARFSYWPLEDIGLVH